MQQPAELINALITQYFHTTAPQHIFLLGCGGSLVDMYPAKYFLDSEASRLHAYLMTANEFVHAPPKTLSADSLVIVCSHGGNTPESVAAARLAQQHQAVTLALSHNPEAELLRYANAHLLYAWGDDTPVTDNPMALILGLCVAVMQQTEGYPHNADFQQGLQRIDAVIAEARAQVQPRCQAFAQRYGNEPLFYILSSGAAYGHAYGFSICSLMEMQWIHASAVHSGEYFHGPFEVTDHQTPYLLLMNEGRTRPLDERVQGFLEGYAGKVETVDARALGIQAIPASVVDYFNPILFYSVLCEYRAALAAFRDHPLETRRYMGKVAY